MKPINNDVEWRHLPTVRLQPLLITWNIVQYIEKREMNC